MDRNTPLGGVPSYVNDNGNILYYEADDGWYIGAAPSEGDIYDYLTFGAGEANAGPAAATDWRTWTKNVWVPETLTVTDSCGACFKLIPLTCSFTLPPECAPPRHAKTRAH